MAKEFQIEILTPGREVLKASVTEVVIPAYDGERGVLANHDDFIGIIGTGTVKIVRDKNDFWFMVSSGVYEVKDGTLTLFAETAETASEVDQDKASTNIKAFEEKFSNFSDYDPKAYETEKPSYDRDLARLEVHKRTELVN